MDAAGFAAVFSSRAMRRAILRCLMQGAPDSHMRFPYKRLEGGHDSRLLGCVLYAGTCRALHTHGISPLFRLDVCHDIRSFYSSN